MGDQLHHRGYSTLQLCHLHLDRRLTAILRGLHHHRSTCTTSATTVVIKGTSMKGTLLGRLRHLSTYTTRAMSIRTTTRAAPPSSGAAWLPFAAAAFWRNVAVATRLGFCRRLCSHTALSGRFATYQNSWLVPQYRELERIPSVKNCIVGDLELTCVWIYVIEIHQYI